VVAERSLKRVGSGVREGLSGTDDGRRRRQDDWRVRAYKGTKGGIKQYLVPSTNANSEITECPASPIVAPNDDLQHVAQPHASPEASSVQEAPRSPERPTLLKWMLFGKAQTPPQRTTKPMFSTPSAKRSPNAMDFSSLPSSFPGPTQMWARTPSVSPPPRKCSSEWHPDKENPPCRGNCGPALAHAETARTPTHLRREVRSRGCNANSSYCRPSPSPTAPRCIWGRKERRSRSRSRSYSNSPFPGPTQMWGRLTQSAASPEAASEPAPVRPPPRPSLDDRYSISPTMPFHAAPGADAAVGASSQPALVCPPGPSLEHRYSISPTLPFPASAPDDTGTAPGGASQPTAMKPPPGPSLEHRYSISPTMPFHASAPDAGTAANPGC